MTVHRSYVDGRWLEPAAELIPVENPATGEVISAVSDSPPSAIDEAVAAARRAQPAWSRRPAIERARYLREIAAGVRLRRSEIARTITEEQGKVLPLAEVEVAFTADYLDYMAEWARRIEGEILPSDRPHENIFLFRAPLGVVGGILPWNFPFFLIARKLAPALVTGNTIVIKPSEETPNNAALFAEIAATCGLPAGTFNLVYGRGPTTGAALAGHPGIDMISMTGSVESGIKVMEAAARNLTKVNLELGGKAPALVLADANLDLAVKAIKDSRVINTGQVCNCAERVYVDRRIADAFTEQMVAAMRDTRFGDPLKEPELDMGPLINARQREKVAGIVQGAVKEGAALLTGGHAAGDRGYYFEPTVLGGVRHEMGIMKKETFGPVVPIVTYDDLDQAIAWANDSEYGLTSSIYTNNLHLAMRAANELRFGETYINRENFEAMQGFHAGWRKSGIEGADGKHGLYEYTQTHTVYLQYEAGAAE